MRITIELERIKSSRLSAIAAYVLMGGKRGENLLRLQTVTDSECAKQIVTEWIQKRMNVDGIEWLDRTAEACVITERVGDWIQTYTARQFWPLDPRPEDIVIEDIAHALALQCRFTGHCTEFYSVAQHSVLVSYHVPLEFALWGLLHDASEAYLTDLSRPLKRASSLGREYKLIESGLMLVICERFNLSFAEPPDVKLADNRLLMAEKRDLMSSYGSLPKWDETEAPIDERIIPWEWKSAERAFLARFRELEKRR